MNYPLLNQTREVVLTDDDESNIEYDMLLSEKGKKIFLQESNDKLGTTIKHKGLNRNVSYKRLIRLELYKLSKHLLDDEIYKPLVMWW